MDEKRILTNGKTEEEMPDYRHVGPGGQQKAYVVLSESERARGYVRPVRRTYTHEKCGADTTMGQSLAETYAAKPTFYGATFCVECGDHFPVGPDGQFVWKDTQEKVGT